MSKLSILTILVIMGVARGSLFGPIGPFGPFGQPSHPFGQAPAAAYQAGAPQLPYFPPQVPFVPPFFRAVAANPAASAVGAGSGAAVGKFRTKPSTVLERLALTDLPADLQQRLDDLLVAHEEGNTQCDAGYPAAVGPLSGFHRRCVALQKAETDRAAMALEQEAKDRAAAAAVAAASANAQPAVATV